MLCWNSWIPIREHTDSLLGFAEPADAEIVIIDSEDTDNSWGIRAKLPFYSRNTKTRLGHDAQSSPGVEDARLGNPESCLLRMLRFCSREVRLNPSRPLDSMKHVRTHSLVVSHTRPECLECSEI